MNRKKKIVFIVNPVSGIGKQKLIEKLVEEHLDKNVFEYKITYTERAKHATSIAKQYADENYDIVVSVGGDGSLNEIAKGLVNTNTSMAIIPTGSGNGLARHLGIPLNLPRAMKLINTGKEKRIDTIQLNNETFVNIAGVGFDAHIGWEFAKYGKRGFSSYLKIVLRELRKYKPRNYELIIENKSIHRTAFLISFANGSQWGNSASIAPLADSADGLVDIAILKGFSFMSAIPIAIKLFRKRLHLSNYLEIIKAKEVVLKQASNIAHIDGEPIEPGNQLRIKVNPLSLKVITR